MAGMGYYDVDSEELMIKQLLAQAGALRGQKAPQGQMVGNGGFQHYVAPDWTQQLAPLTGQIAADAIEGRARGQLGDMQGRRSQEVVDFLRRRPQDGNEQSESEWAASGMGRPGTRALAGKIIEDNLIQAPARREKAQARTDQIAMTNQRYDEDRKARASLAAQQSADKLERLNLQLQSGSMLQGQRLAVQQEIAREQRNLQRYRIDAGIDKANADRDARTLLAGNKAAAAAAGGVMNPTQKKEMAALEDSYQELKTVQDTFKDEYAGGAAVLKNAAAPFGGIIPKSVYDASKEENMALTDWWRAYNKVGNAERHALFGSALTATELQAWKKQALPDTATPEQLKKSITARLQLLEQAMERRKSSYGAAPAAPSAALTSAPAARRAYIEQTGRSKPKLSDQELLDKYRSK